MSAPWLVTGGAGYIGAHVVRTLLAEGIRVVVFDDLSSGSRARVPEGVPFVEGTVTDVDALVRVMRDHGVAGVVHLAGRKSVQESELRPGWYYQENVGGMRSLLAASREVGVHRVVFSSSAAVYGESCTAGTREDAPARPVSVYGETKLFAELLLQEEGRARGMSWIALRYFNVGGAITPELRDTAEVNLPGIIVGAARRGAAVPVFGHELATRDGSCIRDYIHVQDLAEAHVAAVRRCLEPGTPIGTAVNVGTGSGTSVLEMLDAFEEHLGVPIARELRPARSFDPPAVTADVSRARTQLRWVARRDHRDLVASTVDPVDVVGVVVGGGRIPVHAG